MNFDDIDTVPKVDFTPKIVPLLDMQAISPNHVLYIEVIRSALNTLLKNRMEFSWGGELDEVVDQREQFHSLLPIVAMTPTEQVPGNISFYSLAKLRPDAFKFFYNMISCWLMPGRRMNVVLLYAVDFHMPEVSDETYTLCELVLHVETQKELDQIHRNFPIIESELRLGIPSSHYSERILETKGLTMDVKTALIQEYITLLMERMPTEFDQDIITEMQHLIVMSPEEFKQMRECRHLSRIICFHYLFRKAIREAVVLAPQKRQLSLKLFRARIGGNEGGKQVLAVVVGVNFLRDKEVFERMHLLKAIQNYIPGAQAVDHSFFANRRGSEQICTLYLELEKTDGGSFTGEEVALLREELPNDLKDRIESLMHPIFMPRNEEEIIRNILSLSGQIKYLRDIPQVFISFDEQTHGDLVFTVILVRVLRPEHQTIQEMFKGANTFLEYIHDRAQYAGMLRRKFKKEATVFRVKLSKEPFLRADHSIDLNKARQTVVAELCRIVGDVRDFNGGMITKQHEVFCQFRSLLQDCPKGTDLLMENFFYSLTPVIMRNVMEPEHLQTLFMMLLESIEEPILDGFLYNQKIRTDGIFTFVLIRTEGRSLKEDLSKCISKLHLQSSQLATSYVTVNDVKYLGYIHRSDDPEKQELFIQTVNQGLAAWQQKKRALLAQT